MFNLGRLNNKFDVFFEILLKEVEKIIVVDDRRYGIVYLLEFILLEEMVEKIVKFCLEGIDILLKSLVRL